MAGYFFSRRRSVGLSIPNPPVIISGHALWHRGREMVSKRVVLVLGLVSFLNLAFLGNSGLTDVCAQSGKPPLPLLARHQANPQDQPCGALQLHVAAAGLPAGPCHPSRSRRTLPIISGPSSTSFVTTTSPNVQHYQDSTTPWYTSPQCSSSTFPETG